MQPLTKWANRTALVVDDSRSQRAEAARILTALGFNAVFEAEDGREALNILEHHTVDFILTDLNMPGMDGVELISQLERAVTTPLTVVVMSGVDRDVLEAVHGIADASTLELVGVLPKPINSRDLSDLLLHCDPDGRRLNKKWLQITFTPKDVRVAMENHQFVTYLQPKIRMADRYLVGFEALARWHHLENGVIAPICFAHHLETGPLALPFFYRQLDDVCRMLSSLGPEYAATTCSINLPVPLLNEAALVNGILERLENGDLAPERLIIEVTETSFMSNLGASLSTLARLRLKGIGVSMDDYGTGYSSMKQLSRCPFTELKIDREFVHEAHLNPKKLAILKAALSMSQTLHLKAVAEGVETEQDWMQLDELGCDIAQGYYISRPLSPESVGDWLKEWQTARLAIPPKR